MKTLVGNKKSCKIMYSNIKKINAKSLRQFFCFSKWSLVSLDKTVSHYQLPWRFHSHLPWLGTEQTGKLGLRTRATRKSSWVFYNQKEGITPFKISVLNHISFETNMFKKQISKELLDVEWRNDLHSSRPHVTHIFHSF